ncbi:hypothetical protein AB9P05_01230 [Roseivirga sp. BDSF3-8]|uniref:hypothetical protein n=1 Tax=Roseivirga sp. BDSF3-8 TaxID=3241598 RepID=UPI00353278D6
MTEINIERKKKKSSWPWLLGIIVLLLIGYFVLDALLDVEDGNIETEPAEGEVIEDNEINFNIEDDSHPSGLYASNQHIFYTL